jgi:uncharacterized membrane protein
MNKKIARVVALVLAALMALSVITVGLWALLLR